MADLRAEVWTRPGDGSFGRLIADLPVVDHSFTERKNGIADGTLIIPDSYPRVTEILDAPDGASYGGVSSLLRVYDGAVLIHEAIPTAIIPTQQKGDHLTQIDCTGIGSILGYGRLEPFDWDGSDNHTSLFPDWKFGAENLIADGDFEGLTGVGATYELFVADETYGLSISATGGTFTLTVGADTTAAINWDATAAAIESALEAIASVTNVEVEQFEDGSFEFRFKDPENVSPDMTINTGSLTGGSAVLTKVYDGFAKSGTTFTLTVDGDTTAGLDWDIGPGNLEIAIQGLSTVAEVTVTGVGTKDDPWTIVFYDPATPGSFTGDGTGLSGGTLVLNQIQVGQDSFGSWETSRFADKRVDVAQHGAVSTFQLVSDTIAGIGAVTALEFKASLQFGGAQTIVDVTPGSTGQASVWVKSSSATARYRWVLRGVVDELDNCVDGYPSCGGEFTLAANTWTQLTLTDIEIPTGVEEMIFRVAYVGTTEPQAGTMRIWGAEYYEGLPAGTIGYILRTLYEDITDDHGSGDPIYWDNGAGSPYLTLDFSDSLDSAGAAWVDSAMAIEFLKEQSLLNCVVAATATGTSTGGYVWRVVPNSASAGTWYLQVFNPAGDAAWDLSGDDDSPVVRGGKDTVGRSARYFLPDANDVAVEGSSFQIARARNDAAVLALGRIGGYVPNQDLPDLTSVASYAAADLALRLMSTRSLTYRVVPDASNWRPLVDYLPGYTILVEDEPLISKSDHPVDAIRVRYGSGVATEYEVHFDSESFIGNEAVAEGVRRLLDQFHGIRPDATGFAPRTGGGIIPWLVAASDSPDSYKDVAGFLCDGTNDEAEIQAALDLVTSGEVWLAPGNYNVESVAGGTPAIAISFDSLRGLGEPANVTIIQSDSGKSSPGPIVQVGGGRLESVYVYGEDTDAVRMGGGTGSVVRDVHAETGTSGEYAVFGSGVEEFEIVGGVFYSSVRFNSCSKFSMRHPLFDGGLLYLDTCTDAVIDSPRFDSAGGAL